MSRSRPFIRDMAIGPLLDTFLVSGVTTVLVVRGYLEATGFPQIGSSSSGIHIAHALFGGLLLMVALVVALALLPRAWRWVVAVTGGIGFGLFIDELGKFITADVNYFFRPTPALIYVIFAIMYLVFRDLSTRRSLGPPEALANAARLLTEAAFRPLTVRERGDVVSLLGRADPTHPLVAPLRSAADAVALAPEPRPSVLRRAVGSAVVAYERAARSRAFPAMVSAVAILLAAVTLVEVVGFATGVGPFPEPRRGWPARAIPLASVIISTGLVGLGVARMARSRTSAYRAFDRALLVNLFVTQIFLFAHEEFWAAIGFVVTMALMVTVRLGLHVERRASPADDRRLTRE